MTVIILMALMLLFGYQMGRIRFKEKLKKEAYMMHFKIHDLHGPHLNDFDLGKCAGMSNLAVWTDARHVVLG